MKSRTTGSIIAVSLAAIGAIVLVCSRSACVEAVYPLERARQVLARSVWPRIAGVFRGSSQAAENVRLKRELASLSILRWDVERLETENARLRRALSYASHAPEAWLAAGVLSQAGGAASVRTTMRVDKGSLAGVRKGAVVVVPEGLVGLVTDVSPHTSEVTLVTDPALKVACSVETGTGGRTFGILSGGDEDALMLRHLGQAGSIVPPARVLTSGHGGVFPPGLAIGTLQNVRKDARGLAREGEVLPQVDYSTLEDVFIRRER